LKIPAHLLLEQAFPLREIKGLEEFYSFSASSFKEANKELEMINEAIRKYLIGVQLSETELDLLFGGESTEVPSSNTASQMTTSAISVNNETSIHGFEQQEMNFGQNCNEDCDLVEDLRRQLTSQRETIEKQSLEILGLNNKLQNMIKELKFSSLKDVQDNLHLFDPTLERVRNEFDCAKNTNYTNEAILPEASVIKGLLGLPSAKQAKEPLAVQLPQQFKQATSQLPGLSDPAQRFLDFLNESVRMHYR